MPLFKRIAWKHRIIIVILTLIPVFSAFEKPSQIDPKTDYFKAGQKAWKDKNIPSAVSNTRLSFYQKPDSYRLYWYMYFLSVEQNYDETITVLENTPESLWHPCVYETYIYRYYAEALKNRGRRMDAVAVLIKAIDKKDISPERNLIPLIKYWFAYPNLVTQFKSHPRYESIMRDMIGIMSRDWKLVDRAHREAVYNFCIVNAALEMQKGSSLADLYIHTAIGCTQTFPDEKEKYIHALFYRDAMQYWRAHYETEKTQAYNFKFLCPYYRSIDADIEREGNKIHVRNTMDDDFIQNILSENRDNSFVATMAYFYLFRGKILMSFDYQVVNSTIREVNGKHMVYDMIDPHPGGMYFDAYNKYDGIMDFYDRAVPSQYLGGPSPLMFYPFSLYSTNWRFRTYMITGASYSVYIHEIFHNIESYYKITPAHGYLTENKKIWPAWYRDSAAREGVNAQLSYMRGRFDNDIMPKGTDVIRLRETARSDISESAYNGFVKKSSAVPFEKIRESGQVFRIGQELYAKKDFTGAADQYRKAFTLNPCNQQALRHLAYTMLFNLKNKAVSAALYQEYLDNFEGLPFTQEAAHQVLWYAFWDKKDYPRVLAMADKYGKWMQSKENPTMVLFYRGVCLSRAGKYADALPPLEQALKNNVIWQNNLKNEIETCRKKIRAED